MSRGLVLSAALVVVAMSSSANAGVATVQTEGLFKGEDLVNFAKSLLGDAMDFVGDAALNAVGKTKSVISKLGDNDKLTDFLGSRGWEFDASDLVDKNLLEHLKDADSFDAAFAALEEVRAVSRLALPGAPLTLSPCHPVTLSPCHPLTHLSRTCHAPVTHLSRTCHASITHICTL